MHRSRTLLMVCVLLALGVAEGASLLDKPSVEGLFAALCSRYDESYAVCRGLLIARGEEALPYLKQKAAKGTPREQLAAQDVLLRLTEPETVERWRGGLRYPVRCTYRDDGTVAAVTGYQAGAPQTVYDRRAVPFLLGEVWAERKAPLCPMLAHLGDERAIRPIVFHAKEGDPKAGLLRFGRKAIPAIREYLRSDDRNPWARSPMLIAVVQELGDASAAPELKALVHEGASEEAAAAARALCALRVPEAADAIWPVLLQLAHRERLPDLRRNLRYPELRDALLLLADAAIPFLKGRREAAADRIERVVCDALLARLGGEASLDALRGRGHWTQRRQPYAIPRGRLTPPVVSLLIEAANIEYDTRALATLGRCRDPRVFEAIAANWTQHKLPAIEALGDLGDPRGVELLAPFAAEPRHMGGDYQPARRAAWALLCIGGPQAAKALREAAEKNEGLRVEATVYADVLDGKLDEARKLLASDDGALRAAAACALVRGGDVAALPAFLDHLRSLRGPEYQRFRPLLTALGEEKLPAFRRELEHEDWQHRVPVESAIAELTRPKAFRACEDALYQAAARIAPMHVHTYGMVDAGGKAVAGAVGEQGVALLEEAMYFSSDDGGGLVPAVAAAALGTLKQARSLPVLKASARMRAYKGGSPVFEALKKFGEEGAKIAASLPAPDPAKPRFQSRRRRTVHAADMLAGLDHDASVEKLLGWHGAWKAASEEQRRQMDYRIFFAAARKAPDPRLLPALLEIFPHTRRDSYAQEIAAVSLESYDDERVIAPLVSAISAGGNGGLRHNVLQTLTRRAGDRAPALLAEAFGRVPPGEARAFATGIVVLAKPEPYGREGLARCWHRETYDTPEKVQAAASLARKVALPVLLEALGEPESERSAAAVYGLTHMKDAETDRRIAAWVTGGGNVLWHNSAIANHLLSRTPEGAEPGILRALRKQPAHPTLMRLAGAYKIPEAIPILRQQLVADRPPARSYWGYQVLISAADALAAMGRPGLGVLAEVAAQAHPFPVRLHAVRALGGKADARAFGPAMALFRELDAKGTDHPALARMDERTRSQTVVGWAGALFGAFASAGGEEGMGLLRQVGALHADEKIRKQALWRVEHVGRFGRR